MAIVNWQKLHGSGFNGCRALVTGGAGFIGSHLCEALATLGAHVVVLDDLSGGDAANLEAAEARADGRLQLVRGSILDEQTLGRCARDCRYVFHQAALPSVTRSIEEPVRCYEVNATGTLRVLEAARAAGVERVVFAASSSAYGDAETLPKVETMPGLPKSPYAAHKLAGEHLLRAYVASYELDGVALRYFNVFGPRQNANSAYAGVVAAFAKALLQGQRPSIYGDGEQSRDFTFVDNAVHANLLGARPGDGRRLGGDAVNVGCGIRVSVNELARAMAEAMGRSDLAPLYHPARTGDVLHSQADLSRAESRLDYRPAASFTDGLAATVRWYRQVRPWSD